MQHLTTNAHTRALKGTLAATALLVFALGACGSDPITPPPGPTATCTGRDCVCTAMNNCLCTLDDDCNANCAIDGCTLVCDATAKCNASGLGPITINCSDDSDCKGNGGSDSVITCTDTAKCDLKAGDDSSARCDRFSDCKINIGIRGTVDCVDNATCDIKCDGACNVTCASTATCMVNCGADDGGVAGQVCPDGRIVCGGC